jgi:hypothetical protein
MHRVAAHATVPFTLEIALCCFCVLLVNQYLDAVSPQAAAKRFWVVTENGLLGSTEPPVSEAQVRTLYVLYSFRSDVS